MNVPRQGVTDSRRMRHRRIPLMPPAPGPWKVRTKLRAAVTPCRLPGNAKC